MTDDLTTRRKRLLFRSWHRGTREADLVFGPFAERYLPGFGAAALDAYERVLAAEDPDIWDWLTGYAPVPAQHDTEVMALLLDFAQTPRVR